MVPGGTLNHFARDLGLADPETALDGLTAGAVAAVDVGDADGVSFVNNASLGVYGDLVRRREALEHRLPKRLALLIAAGAVLRTAAPLEVEIDGLRDRVFLVFVGNNPYSGTGLTGRESLQAGLLDVRILSAARPPAPPHDAVGDPLRPPRQLAVALPEPALAPGRAAPRARPCWPTTARCATSPGEIAFAHPAARACAWWSPDPAP